MRPAVEEAGGTGHRLDLRDRGHSQFTRSTGCGKLGFEFVLKGRDGQPRRNRTKRARAPASRRKNSMLHLILGGAAHRRQTLRDRWVILWSFITLPLSRSRCSQLRPADVRVVYTRPSRPPMVRLAMGEMMPRSELSPTALLQLLLPPQHPRLVPFRLGLGNLSLLLIQDRKAGVCQNVVGIDF
jgi:hypothetical protein